MPNNQQIHTIIIYISKGFATIDFQRNGIIILLKVLQNIFAKERFKNNT